jgi:hypothetical protein
MPERQPAPSSLPPEKTLLKRLRASRAALLLRNGRWHVMSPDAAGQRTLPLKSTPVIAALVSAGALTEGDDGLFRPAAMALQAVRNLHENPLHRLVAAAAREGDSRFENEHMKAADRLRTDYERAHLAPRLTANYDPQQAPGARHWQMSDNAVARLNDGAIAARQRLHEALEAVGPELSGMLLHVCCLTCGLEEAERRLELPKRSARAVLLLALTRLARHYGFKPPLRHAGPGRIGHWAVADYRPVIPPAVTAAAAPAAHQT